MDGEEGEEEEHEKEKAEEEEVVGEKEEDEKKEEKKEEGEKSCGRRRNPYRRLDCPTWTWTCCRSCCFQNRRKTCKEEAGKERRGEEGGRTRMMTKNEDMEDDGLND